MEDENHYEINHTIVSPNDTPSVPVPAATVLLVRDNNKKIEVFMLKRASRTNFGGAWVFPGGKLDADDGLKDIADICLGWMIKKHQKNWIWKEVGFIIGLHVFANVLRKVESY